MATHDDLRIKRTEVFKGKNEQVFHKFENFHIALAGLAKISEKLEKKIKVPKFEAKNKTTVTSYEDVDSNDIYENGGGDEESEIYDQIYSQQVDSAGEIAPQGLDMAVKELVDFNNSFLTKVLENIKDNFESKPSTVLLKREFFSVFMIDDLLRLHRRLKEKLEVLIHSYVEIGNIFEELKDDFLIYCKITARMRTALEFLCDQMAESVEAKTVIDSLQKDAKQVNRQLAEPGPSEIKDLIAMIPQHVMRYHMVIENIQKQASRAKGKRTDVEKEARRATNIMKNMTQHMDRVSKDYRYIIAMDEFKREIQSFPFLDLHRFGLLKTELKEMMMATGDAPSVFKPFNLLVFNEYIVALETVTREEPTGKIDWWGVPITMKVEEKKFSKCFKIRDFDHIHTRPDGDGQVHLFVNTYKEAKVDPERSFILKFHDQDEASSLEKDMKDYLKEAQTKIYFGTDHQDHECEKFRANGKMEENIKVRCGACDKLLEGLLFTAVRCKTCDKFYHKECFSIEKSDADQTRPDDDKFEAPEDILIEKLNDLQLEDVDLGEIGKHMIISKLRRRRPGTFLLRYSKDRGTYVLSVKNFEDDKSKNITQHVIKTVEINGKTNYYIEKGTVAPTLLELIQKHRRSHFLYIPVTLESPPHSNDEEEDIGDEEKEEDRVSEEEEILHSNLAEAHLKYFFGDITSAEAGETLREEDIPGSFLLRKNGDDYKLSWLTFNGALMHAVIRRDNSKFSLASNQQQFSSIEAMVRNYQAFEQSNKMALGSPLKNPEMEMSITRDKTPSFIKKERAVSRKQGPTSLPHFKGTMTENEAEKTLQKEANASFLLRVNDQEDYFISYKASHRTFHLPIEDKRDTFSVILSDHGKISETSIRRLVDHLKELEAFSTPPPSPLDIDFPGFKPRSLVPPALPKGPKGAKPRHLIRSQDGAAALSPNEEEEYENEIVPEKFPVIGRMENQSAARFLQDKPNGSWILRLNNLGEERITVKKDDRPVHIKLYKSPTGGVSLRSSEKPVPLNTLIEKLIGQGTLKKQILHIGD